MKNKLRHLFICSGYPPFRGLFAHRANLCMQDLLETEVLSIRAMKLDRLKINEYSIDRIKVREIPFPIVPTLNKDLTLIRKGAQVVYPFVKKFLNTPNIIESGSLYPTGEIVRIWLKKAGVESKIVISDAIGDDVRINIPMLKDKDIYDLINFYDGILCNSREMIGIIERLCPEHPPLYEAYRGVDFSKFNNEVEPKTPFKNKQFPTFLYLGGFPKVPFYYERDVKGGIYLLEAWKQYELIQKKGRLIVGGPNSNNKLVQDWRRSLLYPERVEIIGQIDPDDVPGYITGADAVVIPSLSEGLPNLANESQACGKPVLATDVGGTKESVEHNVSGILFESKSVLAILQVLVKFANDGEEAAIKLGENGMKRIREIFPWQRYRDSALKCYREAFLKKGIKIDF